MRLAVQMFGKLFGTVCWSGRGKGRMSNGALVGISTKYLVRKNDWQVGLFSIAEVCMISVNS